MASEAEKAPLVMRIMALAVSTSNRAAQIVRDFRQSGQLGAGERGSNETTEADYRSQACIVHSLQRQFPTIRIIGEESLDSDEVVPEDLLVTEMNGDVLKQACPPDLLNTTEEEIVIWVDPIDNTVAYIKGCSKETPRDVAEDCLKQVTVLIGIAVNGKAVGGVINQPFADYPPKQDGVNPGRCVWGIVGLGVFGCDRKMLPEDQRIIVTSYSKSIDITEVVEACRPTEVQHVGGSGYKGLLLVNGSAQVFVYPRKGTKKWDTCAPEALIHACGGNFTDITGRSISYGCEDLNYDNVRGLLGTISDHDWYIQQIPDSVKKIFDV